MRKMTKRVEKKMLLLVPEIHFLNLPLYWLCSFIFKVKTYAIAHPKLHKLKGRIELLALSDYLSWEKCAAIWDEAVAISEDILSNFSTSKWQVKVRGHNVNMSLKAKQDFQREVEKILFLSAVQKACHSGQISIINSARLKYLLALDRSGTLSNYRTSNLLSKLNIMLDRCNLAAMNLFCLGPKVICQFIYGLLFNSHPTHAISYIYDGVSPRELSIDRKRITFSWIIDNELIRKRDILFLLPKADFQMKQYATHFAEDKELLAERYFYICKFASRKKIFSGLLQVLRVLFQSAASLRLEDLMRESYTIRILRWLPIIESLKPKVYITTSGVSEEPLIEYLNTVGIKTVFWVYACNPFFFTSQNMNLRFRSLRISNIMSRTIVCWNSHFAEFVNRNPQNGLETRAIGPLMCGDETVMVSDKEAICNMLNIAHGPCAKYIAVFDEPESSSSKHRNSTMRSRPNTSEYNYLFMRDLYRLHTECPNTILIYKPKRSLASGKFSYSRDLKKLFADMAKNPRVVVLDYNINPWVPLALADITVCPPFGSPTIAALHYEKLGLFYDPMNLAQYHLYREFPEILTHTYYDLKRRVDQWVNEKSDLNNLMDEVKLRRLQGDSAKSNSSRRFREYLSSLTTNPKMYRADGQKGAPEVLTNE